METLKVDLGESMVEGIIRSSFDVEDQNPNSVFAHNFEVEKVLGMDSFRLNEQDWMSVSDILLDTLMEGTFSQTDFFHDRAFKCLLVLMTKINEATRRIQTKQH